MEELFLEPLLVRDELDVVDEQDIDVSVSLTEQRGGVVANRLDVLVHERLGRDVANSMMLVVLVDVMTNGIQQMATTPPRCSVSDTATSTSCSSTTSSSSRTRRGSRKSSSIPSTPSTVPTSRS
jgi:hypothetical protein